MTKRRIPGWRIVLGLTGAVLVLAGCEPGSSSRSSVYYDGVVWHDYYYGYRPGYRPLPPATPPISLPIEPPPIAAPPIAAPLPSAF